MCYDCVLWKQDREWKGKEPQMYCVISYVTHTHTHTQVRTLSLCLSSPTLRCADAGLWFKQTEILGADRPLHSLAALQPSFLFFFFSFYSLFSNSAAVLIEDETSRTVADLKRSFVSDVSRSSGGDGKTTGKERKTAKNNREIKSDMEYK